MAAADRVITWAELRFRFGANSQGTLIEEDANIWWTPEDIAALSPHPCCFDEPSPKTKSEREQFMPFFEWCRSRFISLESGTALLVDIGEDFWSFVEGTKGRPRVHVDQLPKSICRHG